MGEAGRHDCGLNRQGVARAASAVDGIKAGSLRRNKSEGARTQGPGSYPHCVGAEPAGAGPFFSGCTQHLDHIQSLTPFSSANSSGSFLGGGGGGG